MKHQLTILALAALLVLPACAAPTAVPPGAPVTLIVLAAASLGDAFGEIGTLYQAAHLGTELIFNFAGSSELAAQLAQGSPGDVFASANASQMNVAIEAGRVVSGTQTIFVRNRLVVVLPRDNPGAVSGLADLERPGLKVVLAAAEVPVGQYALDFLNKATQDPGLGAGFKDAVLANVVSYEINVHAVLSKVKLGEADAGVVYTSDAGGSADVLSLAIPAALNTTAEYPIAPVAGSEHAAEAQAFIEFVLSDEGQRVLQKWGFETVIGN